MRPKTIRYTMVALDADGYLLDATGDGPWVTFLSQPGDGCSHQVTLASSDDLSGITFTLIGLDAEGREITEDIAGPNNNSVASVKYYRSLTKVSVSATLGVLKVIVGWNAAPAYTPTYPTAIYPHDGPLVSVYLISGTFTYTVQQTNDDVFKNNPALWWTLGTADLEVDSEVQAKIGVSGIRLSVTVYDVAVFDVTYVQARR
jgi:hypothetical protein